MSKCGLREIRMKIAIFSFIFVCTLLLFASSEDDTLKEVASLELEIEQFELSFLRKTINFLWQNRLGYQHIWPEMRLGWRIIVGSLIGFFGAAFGSVGGIGGGGIYVPMLTLIIGFDSKSAASVSKCMVMGTTATTVYYNLRRRHPTLDMPVIDYDLALLFQPMLVFGISIGVALNLVFADWMVTILLIVLFSFTSTTAFLKGVDTWKKETIVKQEVAQKLVSVSGQDGDYEALAPGPERKIEKVSLIENVHWGHAWILFLVWFAILGIEIAQKYTTTCSIGYWMINLLQVPVVFGASGYEAVMLYTGKRVLASRGDTIYTWKVHQLVFYCLMGIFAGMVGGLFGLGGGFILGPLFLEMGIPPQVSSATAAFAMMFSSSMSVIEYFLLKRFPVPYAVYLVGVVTLAALVGQLLVRRLVNVLGRASIIIFILAFTIFASAIAMGGAGISNIIYKIQHNEYMGFDSLCAYRP